jgi:hypothetical protein
MLFSFGVAELTCPPIPPHRFQAEVQQYLGRRPLKGPRTSQNVSQDGEGDAQATRVQEEKQRQVRCGLDDVIQAAEDFRRLSPRLDTITDILGDNILKHRIRIWIGLIKEEPVLDPELPLVLGDPQG